ncbi:MAG: hypothetical protein BWY80_00123 [Firmicutes bacterium ADurb.Bin456]|nr:MAG: hypothetical protein BWY80_00123 [Firmicutes bacterium ADurb.Bin456]
MTPIIKTVAIAFSLIFIGTVVYLLVKRKLNERHTAYWIFGAVIFLILAIFPRIIDGISNLIGVSYPPSVLFFFGILVIILFLLYQSSQVAALQEKVKELAQTMAILSMETDDKSAGFIPQETPGNHAAATVEKEAQAWKFNINGPG